MFRAVDLHRAASDRGVEVSCPNRKEIRYRRNGHELVVAREPIRGHDIEPLQAVYMSAPLKWLPPHQDEPIGDSERADIARDIVAACRIFGIDTEIVGN